MEKTVVKDKQETVSTQTQQTVLTIKTAPEPQIKTDQQGLLPAAVSSSVSKAMTQYQIPAFFERAVQGTLGGSTESALELGTFFYLRNRDLQDSILALPLLTPEAQKGDKDAQLRLGISLMRLNKVSAAAAWLEKAGHNGNKKALLVAGKCYEHLGKPGQARLVYHRLSELGEKYGYLETLHLDNLDRKKFTSLMRKAYEGDALAQYQLGAEYIKISHVNNDSNEQHDLHNFGLKWLKAAATRGHEPARLLYNQELEKQNTTNMVKEQNLFETEEENE
jgi:hypothetical protein